MYSQCACIGGPHFKEVRKFIFSVYDGIVVVERILTSNGLIERRKREWEEGSRGWKSPL